MWLMGRKWFRTGPGAPGGVPRRVGGRVWLSGATSGQERRVRAGAPAVRVHTDGSAGKAAFSAAVAGWLAFGVLTGLVVVAGTSMATARQTGQRIGHGVVGLVALWSLIAALIFTGSLLTWLVA